MATIRIPKAGKVAKKAKLPTINMPKKKTAATKAKEFATFWQNYMIDGNKL